MRTRCDAHARDGASTPHSSVTTRERRFTPFDEASPQLGFKSSEPAFMRSLRAPVVPRQMQPSQQQITALPIPFPPFRSLFLARLPGVILCRSDGLGVLGIVEG